MKFSLLMVFGLFLAGCTGPATRSIASASSDDSSISCVRANPQYCSQPSVCDVTTTELQCRVDMAKRNYKEFQKIYLTDIEKMGSAAGTMGAPRISDFKERSAKYFRQAETVLVNRCEVLNAFEGTDLSNQRAENICEAQAYESLQSDMIQVKKSIKRWLEQ
jgi:hypothetical protein